MLDVYGGGGMAMPTITVSNSCPADLQAVKTELRGEFQFVSSDDEQYPTSSFSHFKVLYSLHKYTKIIIYTQIIKKNPNITMKREERVETET